jgi:ribosomal protein L34E
MFRRIESNETEQHFKHCPTCGKELKGIRDYPVVLIKDVQRLSVPERVENSMRSPINIRNEILMVIKKACRSEVSLFI